MRSVAMLVAVAGAASARNATIRVTQPGVMYPLGNNVCVTDCCVNCIMTPHTYNFEPVSEPGFDYTVSGTVTKAMTAPAWTAHGKLFGVKVAEAPASGSACEPAQIEIEGGAISTFTVDFTNGGTQSCPFAAGPLTVPGHVAVTINPPTGAFKQYFQTNDATGAMVICLEIDVGPACKTPQPPYVPPGPSPPAPVPPTPSGPLYKCSDAQQCVAAATGIDLPTCQSMCKPVPGPVPPAPASKYACVNGACVVDPTGLDKDICQAAC